MNEGLILTKLCKAIMSADYQRCLGCGRPLKVIGRDEPTCNDCPAGTSDHIEADLLHAAIIAVMKEDHIAIKRIANGPELYDPNFGDEKKCLCEHSYYRHFDSYEDMIPVGCKYAGSCGCFSFRLQESD